MSALQEIGDDHDGRPALLRTIGFPLLVLCGMGTMVGAGFFALSGEVAGKAGMHAPLAFGVAGLLALFSALAFAEWSSRLPYAGGSARYLEEAFGQRWLSAIVGWLIIINGVVSAATLAEAATPLAEAVRHHGRPAIAAIGIVSILSAVKVPWCRSRWPRASPTAWPTAVMRRDSWQRSADARKHPGWPPC